MSNLPGNPHAEQATSYAVEASLINDWPHRERVLLAQQATTYATLALAHEQRTANMIAYWNIMAEGDEPWMDTPFQRELDDMHRDIRVRLGRTTEVPK